MDRSAASVGRLLASEPGGIGGALSNGVGNGGTANGAAATSCLLGLYT